MALIKSYTTPQGITANYWVSVQQNVNIVTMSMNVTLCLYLSQTDYQEGSQPLLQKSYAFTGLTSAQLQGDRTVLADSLVLAYANTQVTSDAGVTTYKDPILQGAVGSS